MPAVAADWSRLASMTPASCCDSMRVTGDVQIHEMAWAGNELWFVNTRFSCLCTRGDSCSFVPRWRPPFITSLAPEDRCHLNGLGVVDGQPRYVTTLGHNRRVGRLAQAQERRRHPDRLASNEVILSGLSMPHSPRWHDGQLWMLESGKGTIGVVDTRAKRYHPIAELPGFTRGLDFCGPLAFIGLSQVRETADFSGISLTERLAERTCGVWVVDTRTGKTVAYLHSRTRCRNSSRCRCSLACAIQISSMMTGGFWPIRSCCPTPVRPRSPDTIAPPLRNRRSSFHKISHNFHLLEQPGRFRIISMTRNPTRASHHVRRITTRFPRGLTDRTRCRGELRRGTASAAVPQGAGRTCLSAEHAVPHLAARSDHDHDHPVGRHRGRDRGLRRSTTRGIMRRALCMSSRPRTGPIP